MSTPVLMPQMGESIAEGTIVRWIKKVGEKVGRDEPLFEISTDKVDAEIPSPAEGVLAEIKVREGETVAVNSVVATIGDRVVETLAPAAAKPAAASKPAAAAVDAGGARGVRRQRRRVGSGRRHAAHAVIAARPSYRQRTQRRLERTARHRRCGPRHEARHPRLSGTPPGRSTGVWRARAGLSSWRARRDRADGRDAQEDRRAHGPEPADVGARALGVRGELRARRRAAREEEGRLRARRDEADVPRLHRQGGGGRAGEAPRAELLARRRQHRLQEGHQSRDCRGARLGADRPGHQAGRREESARHQPRHHGPRHARPREAAEARRSAGRDVHDHEPRHLRRAVRHADHQPAAGRHSRRGRDREARGRRQRRDWDPADGLSHARLRSSPRRRRDGRPVPRRR